MAYSLSNWKPYISEDDYDYLIHFVENAKNNFPNNKMIVLLGNGGRNGKTKLITEIANYLGNDNCIECDEKGSAFLEPNVKLGSYNINRNLQRKIYSTVKQYNSIRTISYC